MTVTVVEVSILRVEVVNERISRVAVGKVSILSMYEFPFETNQVNRLKSIYESIKFYDFKIKKIDANFTSFTI